ncbi:hypothetical protein D3C76_623610 [compost metagenome]
MPANERNPGQYRQAQQGRAGGGVLAQARLIEGQVAIGEDHPTERISDEVAAVADFPAAALLRLLMLRLQGERLGQVVFIHLAQLLVGLQGTGEIQPAQQQRRTAATGFGEVLEKLFQYPGQLGEIVREVQQRAVGIGTQGNHLGVDVATYMTVQVGQLGIQHRAQALVTDLGQTEGHAQGLLALVEVQAFKRLAEARQLIGLAQHQVDRWIGVQAIVVFLDARHQLCGEFVALGRGARQQFRQAHHQHQAVDRGLAALLFQQPQEGGELTGRRVVSQVTAGRIDHHGLGAEIPIAMLGAALCVVGAAGNARGQTGAGQQRGLAGCGHADDQVPRQIVKRRRAAATGRAVGAQHRDGVLEAFAQHVLVAELTRGFERTIDFDLHQVLKVVLGADALVLTQHNDQQVEGTDERHRFQRIPAQPTHARGHEPADRQARQPQGGDEEPKTFQRTQ